MRRALAPLTPFAGATPGVPIPFGHRRLIVNAYQDIPTPHAFVDADVRVLGVPLIQEDAECRCGWPRSLVLVDPDGSREPLHV